MIDNYAMQLALRAKVLTLSVVSTGSITMAATATGYSRAAGSFLADGFVPGMEITPSGFASNIVDTITDLSALTITTQNARTVETSASGRTLTVGLPLARAWENKKPTVDPMVQGVPFVVEQYLPGPPAMQKTIGPNGDLELLPLYVLQIHVPADKGLGAASRYADAVMRLFTPRTAIAVGSDTLRVSAVLRGQLLQSAAGFAVVPVTATCWIRTQNTL